MCWVKIHASIKAWEWFSDADMVKAWLYMLTTAYWQPARWKGIEIPRGAFPTTLAQLSEDLGVTVRKTRTILDRLKATNEIDLKTTNKYTIVTICKYDDYQESESQQRQTNDKQNDKQTTNKRQANNKQNNRQEKKESISKDILKKEKPENIKIAYAEAVKLTQKQYDDLIAKYGANDAGWLINKLNDYKLSTGRQYKDDAAAIRSWVTRELEDNKRKQPAKEYSNTQYWNR